jgi:hypothetical protein
MTLANHSDLVAGIQAFMMDRADLAAVAPDFIALGEAVIHYGADANGALPEIPALRCREMEEVELLTPAVGVCALPADFLQWRRVVEDVSPRRELEYIAPVAADQMYPSRAGGLANHFTIIGASLYSFPLAANQVELTYYAKVPALTALAPTNWLMTKHPGIYLRAALMQAAEYIKNDGEFQKQALLLRSLISGMNRSDQMANQAKAGLSFRRQVR